MLEWNYDDQGEWNAVSALSTDAQTKIWMITIQEDGTFKAEANSSRLTRFETCLPSLAKAQAWCEKHEKAAIQKKRG